MSTVLTRPSPFQLRLAIVEMTTRYGTACRQHAFAAAAGRREEEAREMRAARRRFAAIQRLTEALMYRAYAQDPALPEAVS